VDFVDKVGDDFFFIISDPGMLVTLTFLSFPFFFKNGLLDRFRLGVCIFCGKYDETFSYVWNCDERIEEVKDLIFQHDEILLNEINNFLKEKN
jgi:hypothetical protein